MRMSYSLIFDFWRTIIAQWQTSAPVGDHKLLHEISLRSLKQINSAESLKSSLYFLGNTSSKEKAHCLSGGPRFNKKVQGKLQSHYFGFCFPFPKTLMFKSFSRIFWRKLYFSILKKTHFQTVGQNQLF